MSVLKLNCNSPTMKKRMFLLFVLVSSLAFGQSNENEIISAQKQRELAHYKIIASPNPSPNDVIISAPEGSICRVASMNGTYVGTWEIREEGLNLQDLGSGTYIAIVTFNGESVRRRFVIL